MPPAGRRLGRSSRNLNSGDETPGDRRYTNIVTRYDEVVIPYTSGYLAPTHAVTNVTLQDKCPNDTTEHLRTPYDPPRSRSRWTRSGAAAPPTRRSGRRASSGSTRWLSPNSCQR